MGSGHHHHNRGAKTFYLICDYHHFIIMNQYNKCIEYTVSSMTNVTTMSDVEPFDVVSLLTTTSVSDNNLN